MEEYTYSKPKMDFKIIVEKTYNKPKSPSIGLLMMVKNEQETIIRTINSAKSVIDAIIIYDTGSTDRTVELIKEYGETNKINTYIIQGTFVNFCESRNVSMEYGDTINVDYILMMDANDELIGGNKLKEVAKNYLDKPNKGFLTCQKWLTAKVDKYYNIRFIKNKSGWRYFGSVHEWLKDITNKEVEVIRLPDDIVLYQERIKDGDKSFKRFPRDREFLLIDYKKNPRDSRTLFYLAQTCECLSLFEESLYYSKLRLEVDGFIEEKFHSYMRCGDSSMQLNFPWEECQKWYLKAFENFPDRAEPLIKIASYYTSHQMWQVGYMYTKWACEMKYPDKYILFVDFAAYDYARWKLMGILGFYVGDFELGKKSAELALSKKFNVEEDTKILQIYKEHEGKLREQKDEDEKRLVNEKFLDLKSRFPKLSDSQLKKMAKLKK